MRRRPALASNTCCRLARNVKPRYVSANSIRSPSLRADLGVIARAAAASYKDLDLCQMTSASLCTIRTITSSKAKSPSTVQEFVGKISDKKVKADVMSIAEQLIQKGRQEGERKGRQEGERKGEAKGRQVGWLEGRIQFCQELLGLPVTAGEELTHREIPELKALLRDLEGRLKPR
jgi:hypothetical protein